MPKNIILLIFICGMHLMFSRLSCTRNPQHLQLFPQEVKRSIIGITGKDSTDAYIEIYYTRKKNETENEVVHLWVKPPYLFGDEPVISQIRKVCFNGGTSKACAGRAYFTFTEGGDSYLKIVNHSNNPIEMFIAVNFKTDIVNDKNHDYPEGGRKGDYFLLRYPVPLYKKAPVYYLLFPEQTPNIRNMNVLGGGWGDYCEITNLSYTPTKVGDIIINRPWTIEEVMSLYRAEYIQSSDTILYAYYDTHSIDCGETPPQAPIRISLLPNKPYASNGCTNFVWGGNNAEVYNPENMFGFYKKINGQETFLSEENQWYPMTNAIADARNY